MKELVFMKTGKLQFVLKGLVDRFSQELEISATLLLYRIEKEK